MMKYLLIFLSIFILFSSCHKKDYSPTYTIAGYLYEDCSLQPAANQVLDLYQEVHKSIFPHSSNGGTLATTTTDSTGYFKFEYKDKKGLEMTILWGGRSIISHIPNYTTNDHLILYKNPTANIQVRLNVINPHQIGDTLHITNLNVPDYKILCPLSSGILFTTLNYRLYDMQYDGEQSRIIWWFNTYQGSYNHNSFRFYKYCNDTIFVTVDIN